MKLKRILSEAELSPEQQLLALLRTHCSEFLAENVPYANLYRGVASKAPPTPYIISTTIAQRPPTDTNVIIHNAVDEWFVSNTGTAFRSDHVMFCTGDRMAADQYGHVFAVFPFDGYKYCWSPRVLDLTEDITSENYELQGRRLDPRVVAPVVKAFMNQAAYQQTDLPAAIDSSCEVMVQCTRYIMVNPKEIDIKRLLSQGGQ